MQSTNAIADTSFLIDWVRYDKRDLIFNYYNLIFITENVLNEIRTETPLLWISRWMIENRIKILQENTEVRNKALRVVDFTRSLPVRSADYPEGFDLIEFNIFCIQFSFYDFSHNEIVKVRGERDKVYGDSILSSSLDKL
ncbi:hypothetical protein V6M85_02855 [Sulfolobus tengchongensis]|uniref:DNA-binding protein n=1 Tax=Sulfolobus tengchongensis TaxID=207809 RepID=A0AAX4L214_9CREN